MYSGKYKKALEWLIQALNNNKVEDILEQGDCFYINNLSDVHARQVYKATFNNKEKCLPKICTNSDLNKSRHFRSRPESRIIKQNKY